MVVLGISIRSDDVAQEAALSIVSDFINTCANEGKITLSNYEKFVSDLNTTGHSYDKEIEVKHLDENIGNKSAWTQSSVIGENQYYSVFTSQITNKLEEDGSYVMKKGDIISVTVKNTDTSLTQSLESAFFAGTGKGSAIIQATGSETVKVNGN